MCAPGPWNMCAKRLERSRVFIWRMNDLSLCNIAPWGENQSFGLKTVHEHVKILAWAHIRHFLFRQFLFTQSGNPEIVLLVSVAKKKLLLVKLSRWRAKKSGPKFKMKIVFCISTNIQHDMHCFCFPELNVEPGIPKPASRSLGVLLCTSVFYNTNTTKAL